MSEIVNKVKQSKLETIDLEKLFGDVKVKEIDMKDFLYEGLILREKEFREKLDNYDWSQYKNQIIAVHCSTDAIIPKWAYMLIVQHAEGNAEDVFFGDKKSVLNQIFKAKIDSSDWTKYENSFVLLKGCSKMDISADIYMHATKKLLPNVKKLMYGEACSNVPVYRQS